MKRGWVMLLFSMLLAACATNVPVTAVPRQEPAYLMEAEGGVQVRPAGEAGFAPAQPVQTLPVYSQVETMADGLARLDLPTGTIIRLSPRTLFTLADNQPQQNETLWTRLRLEAGEVWIILRGGQLEVETPSGVSAVRGSLMSTAYDDASGSARVTCLEGHCQVETEQGAVALQAGEAAVLPADGGPPEKGLMTAEDYARWQEFNPEAAEFLPTPSPTPAPTQTATPTPLPPTPTPPAICRVTTGFADGYVNLRSCPDLTCDVLVVVPDGDEAVIQAVSADANWVRVIWQGLDGWLRASYCP